MNEIKANSVAEIIDSIEIGSEKYRVVFGANSVKIVDSFRIERRKDRLTVIAAIRRESARRGFEMTRSVGDMEGEWLLHNIAYALGERRHAQDVDIDYTGDRRWYVAFFGNLLGKTGF